MSDEARASESTAPEVENGGATSPPVSAPTSRPERTSVGRWFWEWTKSIFVAFLLFLFVRTFIVEAFQIPTASMENTLLVGDFLLVNKMAYGSEIPGTDLHLPGFDEPSRGDVVVFEPPAEAGQPPRTNYVKRIVGAPGDTLRMRDGKLHRNGVVVEEPYVKNGGPARDIRSSSFRWQYDFLIRDRLRGPYRPTRDNWGPLVIPEGRYFVMGDNRANSEDSRYWGFVPEEAIKGRPLIIYYSYDRKKVAPLRWLTEIRWHRILNTIH